MVDYEPSLSLSEFVLDILAATPSGRMTVSSLRQELRDHGWARLSPHAVFEGYLRSLGFTVVAGRSEETPRGTSCLFVTV